MKLEHFALYTKDLEQTKTFFEHYFGGVAGNRYYNSKTGFTSYFLRFDGGARLEIMQEEHLKGDSTGCTKRGLPQIGYSHMAFSVGSKEKVDAMTKRLEADGYQVVSGPRTTGDGYYESCILDAEGNRIEITI